MILTAPPGWYSHVEYRIKPEVKPDVVRYRNTYVEDGCTSPEITIQFAASHATGMIKITHDGEGKLKSVEVVV